MTLLGHVSSFGDVIDSNPMILASLRYLVEAKSSPCVAILLCVTSKSSPCVVILLYVDEKLYQLLFYPTHRKAHKKAVELHDKHKEEVGVRGMRGRREV